MSLKPVLMGYVGVDSGQLMVVDPCYLGKWEDNDAEFDESIEVNPRSYAAACRNTLSEKGFGEIPFERGHAGFAVTFASGLGDGHYPVIGWVADDDYWEHVVKSSPLGERILKVEIIMDLDERFLDPRVADLLADW